MKTTILITAALLFVLSISVQAQSTGNGNAGYRHLNLQKVEQAPQKPMKDKMSREVLSADKEVVADDYYDKDFQAYVAKTKGEIALNYIKIKGLREEIACETGKDAKKIMNKINSLELENADLKSDLLRYIHLGKGSWKVFKNEFNEDLAPLAQDIMIMQELINRQISSRPTSQKLISGNQPAAKG